jgi:hypothetical protein
VAALFRALDRIQSAFHRHTSCHVFALLRASDRIFRQLVSLSRWRAKVFFSVLSRFEKGIRT